MTEFEALDDRLRALGFQGSHVLRLVIGRVRITAGVSLRGFSLTFTEVGPRTMMQYEVSVPPNEATKEMIGNLIRLNLIQNHSASVEEWDALQFNLEKDKLCRKRLHGCHRGPLVVIGSRQVFRNSSTAYLRYGLSSYKPSQAVHAHIAL